MHLHQRRLNIQHPSWCWLKCYTPCEKGSAHQRASASALSANDIYHHGHRQTTMTSTADHGDQGDRQDDERFDINDILSEHRGTEATETPRVLEFHMVAELAHPACSPTTTGAGADDMNPSFFTSILGPKPTSLPLTSA